MTKFHRVNLSNGNRDVKQICIPIPLLPIWCNWQWYAYTTCLIPYAAIFDFPLKPLILITLRLFQRLQRVPTNSLSTVLKSSKRTNKLHTDFDFPLSVPKRLHLPSELLLEETPPTIAFFKIGHDTSPTIFPYTNSYAIFIKLLKFLQ